MNATLRFSPRPWFNRLFPALVLGWTALPPAVVSAAPGSPDIGSAVNAFGLDLHHRLAASGGNVVTSPWSIQSALAMTWGGAAGLIPNP